MRYAACEVARGRINGCRSQSDKTDGGSSLQIVPYPHPTLRHKSKPVRRVDAELVRIVRKMFGLMYEHNGIGLAANQVDLPLRLFIVNLSAKPDEGEEFVFINPVLSKPKGNEESEEGCLSFPELYGPVTRPKLITVHAYNLRGEEVRSNLNGMLARVVQHEYDHLDGVVFVDRMTPTAEPRCSRCWMNSSSASAPCGRRASSPATT